MGEKKTQKTSKTKMKGNILELSRDERKKHDNLPGGKTGGEEGRLIQGILQKSKRRRHNQLS